MVKRLSFVRQKIDTFMFMWMCMLALIGLYITVGRLIHECIRRKNTYYIITASRIGTLSTMWPKMKRFVDINELTHVTVIRNQKKPQKGTMFFEEASIQNQVKATSTATLAMFTNRRINRDTLPIFFDLPDINRPLNVLRDYLKDRPTAIQEIISTGIQELYKQLAEAETTKANARKSGGGPFDKPVLDLVQTDKIAFADPLLGTEEEKDESIASQRRLYVGHSLGMLAGVIFAFVFSYNALDIYKEQKMLAAECNSWPTAKGKIDKIEIIRSKGEPYLHSFKVNFAVCGKSYNCEKYSYSDRTDETEKQEYSFGNSHKTGDTVDVFYDLKIPEHSVMYRPAILGDRQEQMAKTFFYAGVLVIIVVFFRFAMLPFRMFEPKVFKEQSFGGSIFRTAFLSVWCCFFFGGIASNTLEPYIRYLPAMPFQ